MQIELLNRKKWKTRVELANAIFEYIEIFHNRQRRHSALGYRTPIEYETSNVTTSPPRVSDPDWNLICGAGQPVTKPFLTPLMSFAFQSVNALRRVEIEVQALRAVG